MVRLRLLFAVAACASAFCPAARSRSVRRDMLRAEASEAEDDNLVVDDAARASLEKLALMTRSSEADEGPPRPKSSNRAAAQSGGEEARRSARPDDGTRAIQGRHRRLVEPLVFRSRGSENKAKLEAGRRLISEGEASQWVKASAAARKPRTSTGWPEALNRLATVEYLRG